MNGDNELNCFGDLVVPNYYDANKVKTKKRFSWIIFHFLESFVLVPIAEVNQSHPVSTSSGGTQKYKYFQNSLKFPSV